MSAGIPTFAHLLGRAKKANRRSEDVERDEDRDERDEQREEEDGDARRSERSDRDEDRDDRDEDREDERDDAKKSGRAKRRAKARDEDDGNDTDGDDEPDAPRDEEDEDEDDEGDEESDSADMRKRGTRAARLRERARCAAIFADAAAGKNSPLAAQIAFGTSLPRRQAIGVLRAACMGGQRRNTIDDRMASIKLPAVGAGDATSNSQKTLAQQIIDAGKRRRGEI